MRWLRRALNLAVLTQELNRSSLGAHLTFVAVALRDSVLELLIAALECSPVLTEFALYKFLSMVQANITSMRLNCTYDDNSEITGRGVLLSFYIQGFLMVANGLLEIEEQNIVPSILTTLVICLTLLYEVFKERSIYLALILHLLLCFHVLASHAVIVWVAEKDNGKNVANDGSPPERWRRWYRIPQFMGVAVLPASTYFAVKKCDESIMGFIVTKSIPIFWFAPMAVLPYLFSVIVTLLLRGRLGERPATGTARQVHVALGTVWTITLIFVVLLLESTLNGNRSQINRPTNTSSEWTLGQILPLALSITPAWPFSNHIVTRFRQIDFKAFLERYSFSWLKRIRNNEIQDSVTAQGNISPTDYQFVTSAYEDDGQHGHDGVTERVETLSTGFIQSFNTVTIAGGQFNNIVGNYNIAGAQFNNTAGGNLIKTIRRETTPHNLEEDVGQYHVPV
ncbi:hypothetical protein BYT27DRAFT_7247155 [Phlegmacium glaucopus]|nr:hypothetical protein BYT27DRAFT_7247155 [Phlegmacium glaucopus]